MILPTYEYRQTKIVIPDKFHIGLDGLAHNIVGRYHRRKDISHSLEQEAEVIMDEAETLSHLSDRRIRELLGDMAIQFRRQKNGYEKFLPRAMAAMVEAAERTLGMRPYPVQIMGALTLYRGYLAEMATGEGKSLTACLPAVLAAWTGRPCHFVTVNDYLASRDAAEMRKFYTFCNVSVGCITAEMSQEERRLNYEKGVVYTTLKELVADFLRDRLLLDGLHDASRRMIRRVSQPGAQKYDGLVLRGLDTVIVDEADSVLIDEAVTPLIISSSQENQPLVEACYAANRIVDLLKPEEDYLKDLKYREIRLTTKGHAKLKEQEGQLPGIWRASSRRIELVEQALTAREFYHLGKQYVIQDGKVTIVDEFTGRLMPNRSWRQGLHQAVEVKENLEVTNPSETLARLSFQRFFRFFRKLSGMSGTAQEAASELWHIYKLPVVTIPTHRPCVRKTLPDVISLNIDLKWDAIVHEIEKLHETDRPVLIGTRSVKASEKLASMLTSSGLTFNLLNAVHHKEEARVVAVAGQKGRITIATNMAGRGTDIKLERGVAEIGGLHVIATERHESGRIDRQLFGRCARQGDPGSCQAFLSLEDELFERFVPAPVKNILLKALGKREGSANILASFALSYAQGNSQRLAFRQRRNVLQMDTWQEEALSFSGIGSDL